jgi:GcrA cell cycle regulator
MRGVWTGRRIALLKELWAQGETATAIAAQLRMSRSAVLGKVFRLRLRPAKKAAAARPGAAALGRRRRGRASAKPQAMLTAPAAPAARAAPATPATPATPAAPAAPAAPVAPVGKSLFELTNDCCRWPHGQPGTKNFFFCGAPGADVEGGRPYCERHARRAYVGRSKAPAMPARAGAADRPIPSPSIVPAGVKRRRLAFSPARKRS